MGFDDLAVGQRVSHYRLLSKLGEGGMGVVFIAEDTRLHRQVAVKFLSSDHNRRRSRTRFLREARSASILNHPNIATVYDYGEAEDGRPFIVMELLRGRNLSELLLTGGLTIERSVAIAASVLEALAEAHGHGIVHRDVKPSNIVFGEHNIVKVLDFGLAKLLRDVGTAIVGSADAPNLTTQTLNGTVLGTPQYVSPEQAKGAATDHRSDLFSLGAVLYECLAGRPVFSAPSVVEIFAQVISPAQPPPPSRYNPAVPLALDRITLKALAKSPNDRYQSAEEFLADLRQVRLAPPGEVVPTRHIWGSSLDFLYRRIVSRGNELRGSLRRIRALPATAPVRGLPRRRKLALLFLLSAVGLILIVAGVRTYKRAGPINSVAVLPFVNETRDERVEYLSDGLTDSLIGSLSRVSDLKVISRNSVLRYQGREIEPTAVGAELNVGAILTGRISKLGGGLHVAAELINTRDRSHIWSGEYDRWPSDAPAIQDEIVRKVIERLRGRSNSGAVAMAAKRIPDDPAAYDHYVKGRWYWNKRSSDGISQAIRHFQQAIDIDPDFALAYAGLADAYVLSGGVQPRDSYLRAKAAAAKALELDDALGEAHATLGFIKSHYEREWADAEGEFKRAVELSPNYATAHHWYAAQLLARGQFDPALRELQRAQELDPLSPIINADIGVYYFYTHQYDLAVNHLQKMCKLFPNFFPAHYYLGWAYTQMGMYEEAVASYKEALSVSKGHSMVLAMLGYTYAISGRKAEAQEILKELGTLAGRQYVSPYRFAVIYSGLGEKDAAFEWLNKAYDELDILLVYVNVTPFSDSLRDDPRFADLIRRMRLAA